MKDSRFFLFLLSGLLFLSGCGGGSTTPPPPHLSVTASSATATAGTPFNITVSALDASGAVVSTYSGTAHFTSTDAQAVLPKDSPLTNGTGSFSVTLKTAGSQTITAIDTATASIAGASNSITVSAGTTSQFSLSTPANATTGKPFNFIVNARDAANNAVSNYPGTVHFTSSDSQAVLPANSMLANGMATFSATLSTAGLQTITAINAVNPSIAGTSNFINLSAPGALAITSSAPPNGTVGASYGGTHIVAGNQFTGFQLSATGGVPGYSWSWVAAQGSSLPPGLNVKVLSFGGSTRCCVQVPVIDGTPTAGGTYNVILTVTDSGSPAAQNSANYTIKVSGQTASFTPTGSMETPRKLHTATLLKDGSVLIIGGDNGTIGFSTAEIFDPTTDSFIQTTGAMRDVRAGHTATLLADGRVLVAGGANSTGMALSTAEIFSPKAGMFTPTGSMNAERAYSTATLLANGKVLVTGGKGADGVPLATAELFDASNGTFTPTGSMTNPRFGHTAILLSDGHVLVVGGGEGTAEEFDPSRDVFTPLGATGSASEQSATLLNDGKVLIVGGAISIYVSGGSTRCCVYKSESLASSELFDPNSKSSSPSGSMGTARSSHTATLLSDGKVLVAGGGGLVTVRPYPLEQRFQSLTSAELFDPASGAFAITDGMTTSRAWHTATVLRDGTVLVTGGVDANGNVLATAELYH